ncbi:MAG: hypothetical protein QE269_12165 [Fimbriimonas sp.]|nr:hypothetical protein [Fimbriimonas sp.]
MISALLTAIVTSPVPSLSIKVDGEGYLRFTRGTNVLYARSAVLVSSPKGLVAADGSVLAPRVYAPAGTSSLSCTLDGEISAQVGATSQSIGRIVLAVFSDKPSFVSFDSMLSTLSKASLRNPGEGLAGVIRPERVAGRAVVKSPIKPKTSNTAGNAFYTPAAEVSVRADSLVEGENISLESIADISGDPSLVKTLKGIDLGRAPYFGTPRFITVASIRANIAAAQVDIRTVQISVPGGAKVARKSQSVSIESINQTVSDAFKKKFGIDVDLELRTRQFAVPAPIGEASVEASNLQIRDNQLAVTVDIVVNKKLSTTLNLMYGTGNIPQVKLGDEVKLKMISSAATVVVKGKAQGTAYLGQKVTVKTDTGALQTGILLANNTVEVRL